MRAFRVAFSTGILSTNHMRAFRVAFSKAETGFKPQTQVTMVTFSPHINNSRN